MTEYQKGIKTPEQQKYIEFIRDVYCPHYLIYRWQIEKNEGIVKLYYRDKEIAEKEAQLIYSMGYCKSVKEVLVSPKPPVKESDGIKVHRINRVNQVMQLYREAVNMYHERVAAGNGTKT